MHLIQGFMRWWNGLAERNGKTKFRNQREAAEFVRSIAKKSGPNAKIIAMRREYEAARGIKSGASLAESEQRISRSAG